MYEQNETSVISERGVIISHARLVSDNRDRMMLAAQVQDIEIRDHLDLSGLRLVPGFNNAHRPAALGSINGTRSIRVRFSLGWPWSWPVVPSM